MSHRPDPTPAAPSKTDAQQAAKSKQKSELEQAQKDAAEERAEEGGYQ